MTIRSRIANVLMVAAVAMGMLAATTASVRAQPEIIKPTSATSASGNFDADRTIGKTIDGSGLSGGGTSGDILTETHFNHAVNNNDYWLATYSGAELTFDLGGIYSVDSVHIWNYTPANPAHTRCIRRFDISFSTDGGSSYGGTITGIGEFAQEGWEISSSATAQTETFTAVSGVTHVKLSNIVNWGDATYLGLCEIRFGAVLPPTGTVIYVK